jgi:cytochrome c5
VASIGVGGRGGGCGYNPRLRFFTAARVISEEDMSGSTPEQEGSNPVRLAIGIAIGTVLLIIGLILLVQYAVSSRSVSLDDPSMSPEAVKQRIAPVARIEVDPDAPAAGVGAPAAPPAAPAPAAMPAATIPPPAAKSAGASAAGKSTYDAACSVCHTAGVAGAPKTGDKAAWTQRLAAGKPALYNAAIKGKGAMPPKGGHAALSDDAVKAAVDHMLAAAK